MTIDEAIKHCEEVAEKKSEDAAEYARLAEKLESTYEKLPAVIENARCVQCSADHRQLAEWLRELKKAKRLLSSLLSDTNDWNSAFRCLYVSFPPLIFVSLLFTAICKAFSDSCFSFLHFFPMGMVLIPVSCTMSGTSVHRMHQALYQI